MIAFTKTTIDLQRTLFDRYLDTLSSHNDSFWDDGVYSSQTYAIQQDGAFIGLMGARKDELTYFYLPKAHLRVAQEAFDAALDAFHPASALVPTNDELFLSLSMDRQISCEPTAYFFIPGEAPVRPPEYKRSMLRTATMEDAADILDKEGVGENIRLGKYTVLRENGIFLGQGFLEQHALQPGIASVGMSVHPDHRRKGVGRSIILHLAAICRERDLLPLCGCGYGNINSRLTLQSAGFVTKTRLLRVRFAQG